MAERISRSSGDPQAETEACRVGIQAAKFSENFIDFILRNSDPSVINLDPNPSSPSSAADQNSAFNRVVDRVTNQIANDRLKKDGVA